MEDGVEGRGRKRDSAKVNIGAELLCKSGKVGRWDQSTEYGVQRTERCEDRAKVQNGLRPVRKWKGG